MPAKPASKNTKKIEDILKKNKSTDEEFFSTKKAIGSQQRLSLAAYSVILSHKKTSNVTISEFISNAIIEYGLKTLPHNKLDKRIIDKHNPVNQKIDLESSLDGIKRLILYILFKTVLSNQKKYSKFKDMTEQYKKEYKNISTLPLDIQIEQCVENSDKKFKSKSLWYAVIFAQQLGIQLPQPPSEE